MKRFLLPATLCMAFAGSLAFAQQPQASVGSQDQQPPAPVTRPHRGDFAGHHTPDPHREALMLSSRLSLTPDQTAKLEPILTDRQQKIAALRADTNLTPQDMHQQMRALREQEKAQFAAVLTPEQQEHLKSMHHGRRGEYRGQGQPQPGL